MDHRLYFTCYAYLPIYHRRTAYRKKMQIHFFFFKTDHCIFLLFVWWNILFETTRSMNRLYTCAVAYRILSGGPLYKIIFILTVGTYTKYVHTYYTCITYAYILLTNRTTTRRDCGSSYHFLVVGIAFVFCNCCSCGPVIIKLLFFSLVYVLTIWYLFAFIKLQYLFIFGSWSNYYDRILRYSSKRLFRGLFLLHE